MIISFEIPGVPLATQSVRFAKVGNFIRKYQPKKVLDWKSYVKCSIISQLPEKWELLDESLKVEYWFAFPTLKSMPKKVVQSIEDGVRFPKKTKPDNDNLLKGLNDCFSGIVWKDDALISETIVHKFYSTKPRIEVEITSAEIKL